LSFFARKKKKSCFEHHFPSSINARQPHLGSSIHGAVCADRTRWLTRRDPTFGLQGNRGAVEICGGDAMSYVRTR
jgi:hypothetical protein